MSAVLRRLGSCVATALIAGTMLALAAPAQAMTIERVISPGGIEAWLVRDPAVPLIAVDFAFSGGSTQDPLDKPGVASMMVSLLDEGAGPLDAKERCDQAGDDDEYAKDAKRPWCA